MFEGLDIIIFLLRHTPMNMDRRYRRSKDRMHDALVGYRVVSLLLGRFVLFWSLSEAGILGVDGVVSL